MGLSQNIIHIDDKHHPRGMEQAQVDVLAGLRGDGKTVLMAGRVELRS
jgi:hypothetical protein